MRISAKGRYAMAAMTFLAMHSDVGAPITVQRVSENLGISKIYLEQVFSLLRRGGLVTSIKGAQGGYQLARMPRQITALDVLESVEGSLFEPTENTVAEKAPGIDSALRLSAFAKLDESVAATLSGITLETLAEEAENGPDGPVMYYI